MATLNITVDDAQVSRVRQAYGVGTNAELRTAIIAEIRSKVTSFEVNKALAEGQASIKTAQDTVIASGETARASAEGISIT